MGGAAAWKVTSFSSSSSSSPWLMFEFAKRDFGFGARGIRVVGGSWEGVDEDPDASGADPAIERVGVL